MQPVKTSFLRTVFVVAVFITPLFGCDSKGPVLRVSVQETAQGNIISVLNADKVGVEIKDIIINDRDECTYIEPAPHSQTAPEFWLEGTKLDNSDRRQIWLQSMTAKDALVPAQNGKYNACNDVCPEGYVSKGFSYATARNACSRGNEYINGTTVCRNVTLGSFDSISLKVGDAKRWVVNKRCQKVVRAKIVTDKGASEIAF